MKGIKQKSFTINAILNIIKQLCIIIFPMITFPYVSRILGVEAYGKLNFSTSMIGYVSLIAGLGVYSYAVRNGSQLRDDKQRFEKFACEVFSINIVSTVIAYVIMFSVLFFWKTLNPYRTIMLILSANILLSTLGTDWVNTVYEDFLFITIRYIVCQSIAVIMILTFVKSTKDLELYALLSNSGTICANILNIYHIRKQLKLKIHFTFKMNLKQHIKPILILFGNMISSMIYLYADSSILGIIQGDIAVAYYTVASKIYTIIKQLLNAVATVATPRFSHDVVSADKEDLNKKFNNLLGILLLLLLPAVAGLLCVGKEIIILLSGIEYVESYTALAILSLSLICSTVACIYVGVVMLALGKDKKILFATTISALINVFLNFILIPKYSYNAAAFTTLLSEFTMMVLGIYFTAHYLKLQIKKQSIVAIVEMLWVFAVCNVVKHFISKNLSILILSIGISAIGYCVIGLVAYKKNWLL